MSRKEKKAVSQKRENLDNQSLHRTDPFRARLGGGAGVLPGSVRLPVSPT